METRQNSGAITFLLVEEETRGKKQSRKAILAPTLGSSLLLLLLLLLPGLGLLLPGVCLIDLSVYVSVDSAGQQFSLQVIIFSKPSFMLEF